MCKYKIRFRNKIIYLEGTFRDGSWVEQPDYFRVNRSLIMLLKASSKHLSTTDIYGAPTILLGRLFQSLTTCTVNTFFLYLIWIQCLCNFVLLSLVTKSRKVTFQPHFLQTRQPECPQPLLVPSSPVTNLVFILWIKWNFTYWYKNKTLVQEKECSFFWAWGNPVPSCLCLSRREVKGHLK